MPAPLRLPDALTSTPSAARRAPAARPAWMPRVRRTAAERAARLRLPACGAEQEIVDAVRGADVVVLSGATGSGKSTQVPQFLLDAKLCAPQDGRRLCVTQPRRVAVLTVSERVAAERGVDIGGEVGYAMRFERKASKKTAAVFATDGLVVREMLGDGEVTLVAYEQPVIHRKRRQLNASVAHNLEGVLLPELEGRIDYVSPTPAEIKKHATGKGNASKALMVEAACERWGIEVSDDNEADALCVLAWTLDEIGEGPRA